MKLPRLSFFLLVVFLELIVCSKQDYGSSEGPSLGDAARLFEGDIEIVLERSDFTWLESPLWNERDKYLLFSDVKWKNLDGITCGMIWKYEPNNNQISKFLECSGTAGPGDVPVNGTDYVEMGGNGMVWGWDGEGDLLLCQHGKQRIVRIDVNDIQNGSIDPSKVKVVVDQYNGASLNSPNDMYFDQKTGDLLFTDPPFGLQRFSAVDPISNAFEFMPQTHCNVYKIKGEDIVKNGLPADNLTKLKSYSSPDAPNGITMTGSGEDMIVMITNFNDPRMILYSTDGSLSEQIFRFENSIHPNPLNFPRLSDGITYWSDGKIVFAHGPGGVYIHQGIRPYARLGFLRINDLNSNSDVGGGYLWLSVRNKLMRIKLKQ